MHPLAPAVPTRSSSRLKDLIDNKDKKDEKKSGGGTSLAHAGSAPEAGGLDLKSKAVSTSPAPAASRLIPLRSALATRAAQFRVSHFGGPGALSGSDLETEGLKEMRRLCGDLPSADAAVLSALLDALAGGSSGISVFELLGSGAVCSLLGFLEGGDLRSAGDGWERALLKRLTMFATAALPPGSGVSPPLTALVQKLQAALSSLETFHVYAARFGAGPGASGSSLRGAGGHPFGALASRFGGSRGGMYSGSGSGLGGSAGGSSLNGGLAMLAQPLKLRLCRHSAERQLRDYNTNVVMIEPLASMKAIEDFLHPRVHRSAESPDAAAAAAAAAAASKVAASKAAAIAEGAAKAAAAATAAAEAFRAETARKSSEVAAAAASSKAQPIPDGGANRRMTRAQSAAASGSVKASGAGVAEEPSGIGGRKKRRPAKDLPGSEEDEVRPLA